MLRSRPYRNGHIITVIRDLFFSGGATSFAARYDTLFIKNNDDGVATHEVPIPLVSLVATAVC